MHGGNPKVDTEMGDQNSLTLQSDFFLDRVGEVVCVLDSLGLSWKSAHATSLEGAASTCLGLKLDGKIETQIKFDDLYAAEIINHGFVHKSVLSGAAGRLLGHDYEMHRFSIHGIQRSLARPSLWDMVVHTFGHKDLQICQIWVNKITTFLSLQPGRPRSLLVFVHPLSGKGNGCKIWESVTPLFTLAKVITKVIVTNKSGHAFDEMNSLTDVELSSYDGVVAVGGDGFFNEILNGFLFSRHYVPYPPAPSDLCNSTSSCENTDGGPEEIGADISHDGVQLPLLPTTAHDIYRRRDGVYLTVENDSSCKRVYDHGQFRFGIIPAGSTDSVVICTTGTRDSKTSALHIIMGKRLPLDIAQIVRWKEKPMSKVEPVVRYAASFFGYGFYGDVIKESEKYRWIGPKRYDYAGTKVFFQHRSYDAEIEFLELNPGAESPLSQRASVGNGRRRPKLSLLRFTRHTEKTVCVSSCGICSSDGAQSSTSRPNISKWVKSRGRFLSIGAAVMSCRNERAPDGLVADAHLSDGFLHLVLISECPHALYLWHLAELAKKGGDPLDFDFVQHHKTSAFSFTSLGAESVWNLDGELFEAHQVSVQVCRGLIHLFATGPAV